MLQSAVWKRFSCLVLGLSTLWIASAQAAISPPCELWLSGDVAPKAALIQVPAWDEKDVLALEDHLFAVGSAAKPAEMDELIHLASLFHGTDHLTKFDDEVRFHLFTALMAGLPDEVFSDSRFENSLLKPWAQARRVARRNWTSLPPRYNQKLMFKFAQLRLFFYLYS